VSRTTANAADSRLAGSTTRADRSTAQILTDVADREDATIEYMLEIEDDAAARKNEGVQETAIRRRGRRPASEPPSASRRSGWFTDRAASSGEQMLAALLFAGMPGSEKNRCLFVGARRGTFDGDPTPILIAGRDNFRDNRADNRLRVTCDVVYT
jgi:hypothetical protein